MLKNFQHYFRFYLATFLFGLLLVGIRWQAAPLGEAAPAQNNIDADQQSVRSSRQVAGGLAMR